jgi:hypothetical protein
MRRLCFQSLALIAFAAAPCAATSALAGSPYYDAPEMAEAAPVMTAPLVRHRAGHYSCSYREIHTRLERKNCR